MSHNHVKFQRGPARGAVSIKEKTQGGMQHHLTTMPGRGLNVILDGVIMQKMIKWSQVA